mmetsp:Transcript_18738/g.75306  ORF Transcript_18738/g.75306 Transcript_18738/m.75306 type:complete len:265 (-) Transcript_18738:129-923(-)
MNFPELEERDGLRWSALIWPWSRLEATRSVIPFAAMYTPLKNLQNMPPLLRYEPVNCKTCTTLLNPYCRIDPNQKIWMCPFCSGRNPIPPQYSEIAQNNLPAEQIFTTVEYMLPRPMAPPPAFVFVLDTCVSDAELRVAKESLMKAISLVPPETIVGLVSFGKNVNVHVLGFTDSVKSYVLRGDKDYTSQNIKDLLNLGIIGAQVRRSKVKDALSKPFSVCAPSRRKLVNIVESDKVRSIFQLSMFPQSRCPYFECPIEFPRVD